jgi:iron complex transport system ATP-binding protein
MLQATDLVFTYGGRGSTAKTVLDRVSATVEPGAIVGLIGPNGAGKTTLLRLLAGMLSPASGQITLNGRPLSAFGRRELARRIAVVPQETRSTFDFSVMDIVLMGRYPHLGTFELERPSDIEIARDALNATGTIDLEGRLFGTLSGGEKQRVVIASALAQASEILLLDEPTASLDLGYQFEIAMLLKRLNVQRTTTLVVSTHDLNFAAGLCDQIILLKDGRVSAQGHTADVLNAGNIRTLYGMDADVQYHERAGHLTVVPVSRAH